MPSQKQEEFKNYLNSVEFVYSSIEFIDDKEVVIVGCESPDLHTQFKKIIPYLFENNIEMENLTSLNKMKFIF